MKTVPIKIMAQPAYGQKEVMVDWVGIPTIIADLFITRTRGFNGEPIKDSYYITHSSGWNISSFSFRKLAKAQMFIEQLAKTPLDWNKPVEEITANPKAYTDAIIKAYNNETTNG